MKNNFKKLWNEFVIWYHRQNFIIRIHLGSITFTIITFGILPYFFLWFVPVGMTTDVCNACAQKKEGEK
jgi:hypothetical protein